MKLSAWSPITRQMTCGLVGAGTRSVVQLLGDLDPDFDPVIAVLEVWGEATDPTLRLEVWAALRPGLALLKSEIEPQSRHGLSKARLAFSEPTRALRTAPQRQGHM
jgi:hypothetical protein